ncbi:MAG: helix-turn-helix domain-containing protein, partial [Kiritimatiellia bacterium]
MQLTVQDVARFLNLPEEKIYRMIRHGEIPARRIHDQYHFNRTEFLDWAMAHRRTMSADFVKSGEKAAPARLPRVSSSLKSGGI